MRTVNDELWGPDDDYVPVYGTSPVPGERPPDRPVPNVGVNDVETGEDFLAAIDKTIK